MLKLTTEELFSGDVAPSAAKEEMSWCSAAAPFKGVKQNKYSVQTSTSPVLDLAWAGLAWPALEASRSLRLMSHQG